ncbi:MAG: TonB family protein [Victivallaceae bacterium]|nr:TonB family protein [Victivallaceae bacterium]
MSGRTYKADEAQNALVDARTRKKIFRSVVIAHLAIIGAILIWSCLAELLRSRQPKVITVSLYTPAAAPGSPRPTAPAPPVPVPRPRPAAAPPAQPKPKIAKTAKKKWQPAKTIKVSRELVYIRPRRTAPKPAAPEPMDKRQLLAFLNQDRVKIHSGAGTGVTASYENQLGAYLYRLWDTPDKSVLGGKRPEVKIRLDIAADGRLRNSTVLKPSGIAAMDESVKQLLGKIKLLPAPENGPREVTLILEVTE